MAERAANNARQVQNFQLEVNEDANDIQERVARLRAKIEEHRGTRQKFDGFLCGLTDSYVVAFDDQIAQMNTQLDKDKLYW